MTVEKAMYGWPRYIVDEAILSGGSYEVDYPITNLQDEIELSKPARTTNAVDGSFEIKFTLPRLLPVRLAHIHRHNFSIAAKWQILLYYTASWTTEVYDSGQIPVWLTLDLDAEWEDNNWWERTYTDGERREVIPQAIHLLPSVVYAQSGIIRVYDENNVDGYLQAALAEVSSAFQPPVNFRYGAQYGLQSRSLSQEAAGGAEYFDRRTKRRVFSGEYQNAARGDLQAKIYELQKLTDIDRPFLYIKNPSDQTTWLREAGFVRHEKLDLLTQSMVGRDSVPFSYKEAL